MSAIPNLSILDLVKFESLGDQMLKTNQNIVRTVLTALAVGLSDASITLEYLGGIEIASQVNMLSLGLFALALAALQK